MSTGPYVQTDLDERDTLGIVATVTMTHEKKLNILSTAMIQQLGDAVDDLMSREQIRVVVLTGAGGRAFSGGADISELASITSPTKAVEFITRLHHVCSGFRKLPIPVIARIEGHCYGGALELAAACDMRIATKESRFGMPEVNVGLPSVIEAALLPQLVGWGKTRELVYTGRIIDAEEAYQCRLIERVVSKDLMEIATEEWIEAILRSGPRAIRLQKELVREWENLSLDEAIGKGIEAFEKAFWNSEPHTFLQEFLNRPREPRNDA